MGRITHFSKHALTRLEQRSTLSFHELARILDCGVFVKIGSEPGFNREHRLFYSMNDDSYYVAIQDVHTGGVVTVLPPNYYENICFRIKDSEFKTAKEIAQSPPKKYEDYENVTSANNQSPNTFIVSAHFDDIEGNQKTKIVVKTTATPYKLDLSNFIKDKSLEGDIQRALIKKGIKTDSVWSISFRLGKNGERIYFDWIDNALA